jgi:hypothetical protein
MIWRLAHSSHVSRVCGGGTCAFPSFADDFHLWSIVHALARSMEDAVYESDSVGLASRMLDEIHAETLQQVTKLLLLPCACR